MDEFEKQEITNYLIKEKDNNSEGIVNQKYLFEQKELSFYQLVDEVENNSDLGQIILKSIARTTRATLWQGMEAYSEMYSTPTEELLEEISYDKFLEEVLKNMKNPEALAGGWEGLHSGKQATCREFVTKIVNDGVGLMALYAATLISLKAKD